MGNSAILTINYLRNSIDVSPPYQRNSDIWTREKRQLLIDSILNNFDVPKIYFHLLSKPRILASGKAASYAIIDGKQRLESIWKFLDGEFPLASDFKFRSNPSLKVKGMSYAKMSLKYPELKVAFDGFNLPVWIVDTDDVELIEEMFSRLNEAVPLSSAEKRNALGGVMVKAIKKVSTHRFFERKVRITNRRYQHLEVAIRLLFLEYTIQRRNKVIDTKKLYLDQFVKSYKGKVRRPRSTDLVRDVTKILDVMLDYFTTRDRLLRSQADVPIYYLLFRYALKQKRLGKLSRKGLLRFETLVAENRELAESDITKADFDLLEFDRMSIQGTNDASSIKERLRIMAEYFRLKRIYIK